MAVCSKAGPVTVICEARKLSHMLEAEAFCLVLEVSGRSQELGILRQITDGLIR